MVTPQVESDESSALLLLHATDLWGNTENYGNTELYVSALPEGILGNAGTH